MTIGTKTETETGTGIMTGTDETGITTDETGIATEKMAVVDLIREHPITV